MTLPGDSAENPPLDRAHLDVLFVDDSENLSRAMKLWLTASGYSTRTATTAEQAEQIAKRELPQVVITDIGLPDISGHDLRLRLRDLPGIEGTRFVALTGRRDRGDERRAIEAGFDAFIAKPPDFEKLAATLRKFIPNGNSGA